MSGFEPALCTVTFRGLAPEAIISLTAEAGLAAIEWAGDAHVPPGDLAEAREIGRLGRANGFSLSYGSYIAPPSDGMAEFFEALATASALGAENMRIWPGTRGRDSADYGAEEVRDTAKLIRDMGAEAARKGIAVSLEYHPNSLTDTTDSALRLMEEVGHDNVYLYWQPRPWLPLDEALAEIGLIGRHVSHIHVFAWDRDRNRFPLSSQADYWRAAIETLDASRWTDRRFAMLEFVTGDDPDNFRADAATLKEILKG